MALYFECRTNKNAFLQTVFLAIYALVDDFMYMKLCIFLQVSGFKIVSSQN